MKQRQLKRFWILAVLGCLLTGCGNSPTQQDKIQMETQGKPQEATTQSVPLHESMPDNVETVTAQSTIKELEEGLSIVRFEGKDGFSAFLEKGGASSDAEVLGYLLEHMLGGAEGLIMEGNPFGCSTISAPSEDGGFLFGRNFDWYHCNALIVASYPENAYASISSVNTNFITQGAGMKSSLLSADSIMTIAALYAPLDGMNEEGLCVSVNMIADSDTIDQNTEKPDITTTTAVRLLLNQAADVEEAVQLLETYDLHASFGYMVHFALSDAKGNHVAVEYVNDEMLVVQTPVVTNFYLSGGEKQGIGTKQSYERYDILMEALEEQELFSEEDIREVLDSVSKHNYHDGETTEWSIIYNQTTKEAVYYHRENYKEAYRIQL